jgi:hypothetical protein
LGPSAETAQSIEPPVHRSWAVAGGDHRLTVSDQVEFAQPFDAAATVVRRMPKEEMPQDRSDSRARSPRNNPRGGDRR